MIDPKSLRIGNYYQHKTGILRIEPDNISYFAQHPELNISGIPLSEQELIRLGFRDEQIYEAVRCWRTDHFALSYHANEPKNLYLHGYGLDSNPVLHVHQLQNLYYSLTGTELTYKVENETIKSHEQLGKRD